jgi:hypothetical protein
MYWVAKILQVLGLFITLDGLYVGIRLDDMQTEVILLALGAAIFYGGRRLEKNLRA